MEVKRILREVPIKVVTVLSLAYATQSAMDFSDADKQLDDRIAALSDDPALERAYATIFTHERLLQSDPIVVENEQRKTVELYAMVGFGLLGTGLLGWHYTHRPSN